MAKISKNHVILFLCLVFFNLPSDKADTQIIRISSDSRPFILFEDYGFTNKGHLSIKLSSISVNTTSHKPINSSLIGFFLGPTPSLSFLEDALFNGTCIIGKPSILPVFTFREIYLPYTTSYKKDYQITMPDLYYIFFANCVPGTSVSMFVHLETYNLNPKGFKDYLDDHFVYLPKVTFMLWFIYLVFLILWLRVCFKNKSYIHKVHLLMSILLLMKFLTMLCSAENQHFVRVTGDPQGWDLLWFIFHFFHALMFDAVVVLIGSGWSLLRSYVPGFQQCILGLVMVLQVVANIAFILMHGGGPSYQHYRYWVVTFYVVDFVCGIAIILPVTDSIETLKETSKTEGKEAKNLAKLKLFHYFHNALQAYVYTIRMGMFILRVLVKYRYWWWTFAMEHIIDLLFYVMMYHHFMPSEKIEYIVRSDREEEENPLAPMQGAA